MMDLFIWTALLPVTWSRQFLEIIEVELVSRLGS